MHKNFSKTKQIRFFISKNCTRNTRTVGLNSFEDRNLETERYLELAGEENLQQIQADIAEIVAEAEKQVNERAEKLLEENDPRFDEPVPVVEKPNVIVASQQFIEREAAPLAEVIAEQIAEPIVEVIAAPILAPIAPIPEIIEKPIESRIPVANSNTSTPIKVKTIKKHSRVNRELNTNVAAAPIRPAVGSIEWDLHDDTSTGITEISTLNLEDVCSPNEHQSYEPVVIISPSDDYSGEIDEVILVQTPGDDGDVDEDDADDDYDVDQFSPRHTTIVTTTTTTQRSGEPICVTTEEHYPNGDIIVQRPPQPAPRTITVAAALPQLTISTDDDAQTHSLSINSESDSEDGARRDVAVSTTRTTSTTITTNTSGDTGAGLDSIGRGRTGGGGGEKTFGSSSGSDVALHEPGVELSDDDEPGTNYKIYEYGYLS